MAAKQYSTRSKRGVIRLRHRTDINSSYKSGYPISPCSKVSGQGVLMLWSSKVRGYRTHRFSRSPSGGQAADRKRPRAKLGDNDVWNAPTLIIVREMDLSRAQASKVKWLERRQGQLRANSECYVLELEYGILERSILFSSCLPAYK